MKTITVTLPWPEWWQWIFIGVLLGLGKTSGEHLERWGTQLARRFRRRRLINGERYVFEGGRWIAEDDLRFTRRWP